MGDFLGSCRTLVPRAPTLMPAGGIVYRSEMTARRRSPNKHAEQGHRSCHRLTSSFHVRFLILFSLGPTSSFPGYQGLTKP
jgi:hypothetical protein